MKKFLLLILLCQLLTISAKKQPKLVIEETLYFQDTSIQLCYLGKQDYILIINNYDNTFYSLVVFSDNNYTARQVFGELLIAYYKIKNSKKEIAEYEGEKYIIQRESQQEYFGKVHTDNKETLQNALKRIAELEAQIKEKDKEIHELKAHLNSFTMSMKYTI